jgi:uncharacterized protein (DUF2336 family)
MIVRDFLQWVRTAPAVARADATAALARAYLYSDLSPDDRAAAEGAMLMLLDDASPLVRRALAVTLAGSGDAPPAIVLALASDQPEIATPVLRRSPLLLDADLVDAVGKGEPVVQAAIATRTNLPISVAAAIAEVGSAEACLLLVENPTATLPKFSLERIIDRYGHLAAIRETLLPRRDLPPQLRQALVLKLSTTLAEFVVARAWLDQGRAETATREACEKSTVALAGRVPDRHARPLIVHLRATGQLTAGLLLRALLSGNITFFEEGIAELSELPLRRISAVVYGGDRKALDALLERAGLPRSVVSAARVALETMREIGFADGGRLTQLKRRIVERVLTQCEELAEPESQALLVLLRRFALEASREEARRFCDELESGSYERERAEIASMREAA